MKALWKPTKYDSSDNESQTDNETKEVEPMFTKIWDIRICKEDGCLDLKVDWINGAPRSWEDFDEVWENCPGRVLRFLESDRGLARKPLEEKEKILAQLAFYELDDDEVSEDYFF